MVKIQVKKGSGGKGCERQPGKIEDRRNEKLMMESKDVTDVDGKEDRQVKKGGKMEVKKIGSRKIGKV